MQIDLVGKRALVAGGSRGIGLAIAHCLASAGADVSICARTQGPLDLAAHALKQHGHRVIATACDLADAAAIKNWVEQTAEQLGGVDILVNNASGFGRTDDEAGWAASVQIDLMALVRACHAAIPFLEKAGGSIIHISSISGLGASVRTPPYGAIKAAVMEYTQTQALTYASKKIRVNCIAPAMVATELLDQMTAEKRQENFSKIPMGRAGLPEEIASIVAWLSSDDCSFCTGTVFDASGGRATY